MWGWGKNEHNKCQDSGCGNKLWLQPLKHPKCSMYGVFTNILVFDLKKCGGEWREKTFRHSTRRGVGSGSHKLR